MIFLLYLTSVQHVDTCLQVWCEKTPVWGSGEVGDEQLPAWLLVVDFPSLFST